MRVELSPNYVLWSMNPKLA